MAMVSATWSKSSTPSVRREIDRLVAEYDDTYTVAEELRPNGGQRQSLREAARIELGMRRFPGKRRVQSLYHHLRRPERIWRNCPAWQSSA